MKKDKIILIKCSKCKNINKVLIEASFLNESNIRILCNSCKTITNSIISEAK